jgi:hypothetical protein
MSELDEMQKWRSEGGEGNEEYYYFSCLSNFISGLPMGL